MWTVLRKMRKVVSSANIEGLPGDHWPVPGVRLWPPGLGCCHHPAHPALSSSLALKQATREHTGPRAHISFHNKRQHWELLSLIYGEKIWAGPPGPVSPCHRQSVNTVLGSEEQNLFYPPGRQCQCFHLDLSPQRDHLTKLLPFRSQIIWSAWIHKEGWVVHKVFNLHNNQVSTVIVWVRNSLTQRDKKLMFILSTLIAWHLFGIVQVIIIWELAYNSQKLTQILWPYQPQLHKSWTSLNFCSLIFNLIFRLPTRVRLVWLWTWTGWGSVRGGGLWPPASPCLGRSEAPPPGPRCHRSARMTRGRGRSHQGRRGRGQSRGRAIPRLRSWTQVTSRGWRETGRQKSSSHQVSEHFEFLFLSKGSNWENGGVQCEICRPVRSFR